MATQHQHPRTSSTRSKAAQARSVSLSEAARLLGKHRNTISRWIDQGAPAVQIARREDGVDWRLDLAALVEWRIERTVAAERERLEQHQAQEVERLERAVAQADDDAEPMSRSEALRRRAVVEAKLRELDLAEREGDVASLEVLTAFAVDLFTSVRQRFLHLSGKLATEVAAAASPAECQRIVHREVVEILEAIADEKAVEMVERTTKATQARARGPRQ